MILRVKWGNTSALAANLFCEETMNKRLWVSFLLVSAAIPGLSAQEVTLMPPESIVAENVPKIPTSLVETAGRYGAYRSAGLADWNPTTREMLIATRFGDTSQLHLVSAPGRGTASTYVLFGRSNERTIPSEWWRLHCLQQGYWRRRMVPAVSLRFENGRSDFADRRKGAQSDGPLVVERR